MVSLGCRLWIILRVYPEESESGLLPKRLKRIIQQSSILDMFNFLKFNMCEWETRFVAIVFFSGDFAYLGVIVKDRVEGIHNCFNDVIQVGSFCVWDEGIGV